MPLADPDAARAYRRARYAARREEFRRQNQRRQLRRQITNPRRSTRQRAECHFCGRSVCVSKAGFLWRHYAREVGVWCKGSGDAPLGYEVAS